MGSRKVGRDFEDLAELRDGFVIALQIHQVPAIETLEKGIERIQFQRLVNLPLPLVGAFPRDQEVGVHEMTIGTVGVVKSTQPGYSADKYVQCLQLAQNDIRSFGAERFRLLEANTSEARIFDKIAWARTL
jgi:hypothetical protein